MLSLKSLHRYDYIAFITGFSLLTYELVATRLLAPTIGSSIYAWTSIIGVIIAALSAGYIFGGKIADKRVEQLDIALILLASSFATVSTLIIAPAVLTDIPQLTNDPRLQGLIASLLLFSPTSFLIGAVSPYLARLKNVSLQTTGTTIASLSSLNALGSIAGTFFTGFIFLSYIGSKETLLIIGFLLFCSSWLIEPQRLVKKRLIAAVLIAIVALLSLSVTQNPAIAATIDTPSATYNIVDIDYKGRPVRAITAGPGGLQSGIYRDGDNELVFDYTRKMAELVENAPKKDSILILGGGAFTLPQHLAQKYPEAAIDVVEIDPELLAIAKKYFGYTDLPNVSVINQDARIFLNKNSKRYDIVLVDVYTDTLIPFSLTTDEYAKQLKRSLSPRGIVAANIIGSKQGSCGELLSSIHNSYQNYFPFSKAYPLKDTTLESSQNIVITYSQNEQNWLPKDGITLGLSESRKLTDNYAPIEFMQSECRRNK